VNTIGRHFIVEASRCNPDVLNDIDRIESILAYTIIADCLCQMRKTPSVFDSYQQ